MGKKLSAANPYLRDPELRERALFRSVASSSAIEGIRAPFRQVSSGAGKSGTVAKPAGKTRSIRVKP